MNSVKTKNKTIWDRKKIKILYKPIKLQKDDTNIPDHCAQQPARAVSRCQDSSQTE